MRSDDVCLAGVLFPLSVCVCVCVCVCGRAVMFVFLFSLLFASNDVISRVGCLVVFIELCCFSLMVAADSCNACNGRAGCYVRFGPPA